MAAGRPRTFCTEEALESALRVFWEKGYEGASLQDLTDAMGINRPSLYAAFGNKEALFLKALDYYAQKNSCMQELLDTSTAFEAVQNFLYAMADILSDPDTPHTCLVVSGALSCSDESIHIKEALAQRRSNSQKLVQERLERAKKEGDLVASADPATLARYISTVCYGLSVQSGSGATRKELHDVIDTALLAWPKGAPN